MSASGKIIAQRVEVERCGRGFSQEDENLPEVFLEEMLGKGQRVGQDLAERIIKRERVRGRSGFRQRLQFRFEFQKERGFSDVRRTEDQDGGSDTGFSFEAYPQKRGQFLFSAEELTRAERKFRALAP
jgi:hypothetical protein